MQIFQHIFHNFFQKNSVLTENNLVLEIFVKNGGQRLVELVESEGGAVEILAKLLMQTPVTVIEGDLPFDEFL